MRSRFILLAALAAALLPALPAATLNLSIADPYYVGSINDGIPSSPANEVTYINTLIGRPAGSGNLLIGTETYNRVGSTLFGALPSTSLEGAVSFQNLNTVDATGFNYVLGKYDASQAGSLVWYLGGITNLDLVALPTTYNGFGLSHTDLFNGGTPPPPPPPPPPPGVPEGGSALILLGAALGTLAWIRRLV